MKVGTEWLVDAAGCSPELLRDLQAVRATCAAILRDLKLKVVGDGQGLAHQFPSPGGVTMMYLLTESHLACHTYPEHGIATFSLSCCRPRPRWDWEEQLRSFLGATQVTVRSLPRGFSTCAAELQPEPATSVE
jgi:S-adenosylmethionine decarboxylase